MQGSCTYPFFSSVCLGCNIKNIYTNLKLGWRWNRRRVSVKSCFVLYSDLQFVDRVRKIILINSICNTSLVLKILIKLPVGLSQKQRWCVLNNRNLCTFSSHCHAKFAVSRDICFTDITAVPMEMCVSGKWLKVASLCLSIFVLLKTICEVVYVFAS